MDAPEDPGESLFDPGYMSALFARKNCRKVHKILQHQENMKILQ
jgi:hypothetical protein